MTFKAYDVNDLYTDVLNDLVGLSTKTAPRGMPLQGEILGATLILEDAARCVVSIPARALNYHFMVAEWWWIATGQSSLEAISPFCNEIHKFSDNGLDFFGAYGPPWRAQVDYVIEKLKHDNDSRQAVLTIWRQNPPKTKDVPCTVAMQYLLREGRLHAIVTMRSSDAWLGLPYDIFNFAQLQSAIAGELGVPVGFLQLNLGSLHLYSRNVQQARGLLMSDNLFASVSPLMPVLPGLPPPDAEEWPLRGSMHPVWSRYADVLRHRDDPEVRLSQPWYTLITGRRGNAT